ncbi:hypothetical protein NM962_14490 [Mycobacterium sp. SVM_VP21]|nr:hypothetical protein NM962_14490 [Mycobacterium sp. SVM_VP21]
MQISATRWFTPLVAATCIAGNPAVIPAVPHADVQVHPVVLTAEALPADLLESLGPGLLESLGSSELSDIAGDAAGGFFGLGYLIAEVIGVFNSVVSALLTPISWIPIVGSLATSLIWAPINLIEGIIWPLLVGSYYPYYPYYAEATDSGAPVGLSDMPAPAEFSLPDTALNVDALEAGDLGDAVQYVGASLLDMFL